MAQRPRSPVKLQALRELSAQWGKIVARRALADTGPDSPRDLAALEQRAAGAAAGRTEGTLSALREQHPQTLPAEQPGPACGPPGPVRYEDRSLTVQGGQAVPVHEPVCYCPDCRRDFFPPADATPPGQP
jgi:hypothetical protein